VQLPVFTTGLQSCYAQRAAFFNGEIDTLSVVLLTNSNLDQAVLLLLVVGLVMLLEQVLAKVAGQVAPHGVDVIGVVLRII
jgi:hypothetical protein